MKQFSQALRDALSAGEAALSMSSDGDLGLGYRQAIMNAMGPLKEANQSRRRDRGWYRRSQLALSSARRVLPIWDEVFPKITLPHDLISLGQKKVDGATKIADPTVCYASHVAVLEDVIADIRGDEWLPAYNAAWSALRALATCLHDELYDPGALSVSLTDIEWDADIGDAGWYACCAVAGGGTWEEGTNAGKRRDFWEWWLRVAVPEAWNSVEE